MSGVLLKDVWNNLTASQHIKCIQSIARLIKQLCAIHLPCYGSIYHASDAPKGAVYINDRYIIGSLARKRQCARDSLQSTSEGGCETPSGPCELQVLLLVDSQRLTHKGTIWRLILITMLHQLSLKQRRICTAMCTLHPQSHNKNFSHMHKRSLRSWSLEKTSETQVHHSCPIQIFILGISL